MDKRLLIGGIVISGISLLILIAALILAVVFRSDIKKRYDDAPTWLKIIVWIIAIFIGILLSGLLLVGILMIRSGARARADALSEVLKLFNSYKKIISKIKNLINKFREKTSKEDFSNDEARKIFNNAVKIVKLCRIAQAKYEQIEKYLKDIYNIYLTDPIYRQNLLNIQHDIFYTIGTPFRYVNEVSNIFFPAYGKNRPALTNEEEVQLML